MLCCLLPYHPSLSKNVWSTDHCVVCVCMCVCVCVCLCVHIHTHAFQLLNQLAGLHEVLYKCYAITAHTTSYGFVFL
jgi:hypothetical protein